MEVICKLNCFGFKYFLQGLYFFLLIPLTLEDKRSIFHIYNLEY